MKETTRRKLYRFGEILSSGGMALLTKPRPEPEPVDPHFETYEWGEIVFDFYDGWMDDVRSCAHGLRDRLANEGRRCISAERLLAALRSIRQGQVSPDAE